MKTSNRTSKSTPSDSADFLKQIAEIQRKAKPYVKRSLTDAELKAARTEAWGARGKKLMGKE